jgi:hypothetical protein
MATKAICLLQGKNDLKVLLALGIKDLWKSSEPNFKSSALFSSGLGLEIRACILPKPVKLY